MEARRGPLAEPTMTTWGKSTPKPKTRTPKVHFWRKGANYSRCGRDARKAKVTTEDEAEVTCGTCDPDYKPVPITYSTKAELHSTARIVDLKAQHVAGRHHKRVDRCPVCK